MDFQVVLIFFLTFWPHLRHMGSWLPDRGLNLCPLHWKHRALTIGPPGKSLGDFFDKNQLSKGKRGKVSEGGEQRAVKTRQELQNGVEKRDGQNR